MQWIEVNLKQNRQQRNGPGNYTYIKTTVQYYKFTLDRVTLT